MAFRGRREVERVEIAGGTPLDAVGGLTPNWERPPWADAWEAAWIEAVDGGRKRCVVTVPVRHGKTFTFAAFAAWTLARKPEMTIAFLTYNQRLTDRFSRVVRNFSAAAGVEFSPDHNRVEEWRTTSGGGLLCSAVGGPITGFGADLIVVDDPIKGREEAESERIRELTWDWLTDDVYTRLEPRASFFIIGARWHEDDPIGRVLRGDLKGEEWTNIHYRAIEVDEWGNERSLWPSRFTLEELRKRRAAFGGEFSRTWLSLYQGEPRPSEGALFRGATFADEFPVFA